MFEFRASVHRIVQSASYSIFTTDLWVRLAAGHVEVVELLLSFKADVSQACEGSPPLHLAVCSAAHESRMDRAHRIVQLLLRAGAPVIQRCLFIRALLLQLPHDYPHKISFQSTSALISSFTVMSSSCFCYQIQHCALGAPLHLVIGMLLIKFHKARFVMHFNPSTIQSASLI